MSKPTRFELRRRTDGNLLVGLLCPPGSDHIVWSPPFGMAPVDYPDPEVYQWRCLDEDGDTEAWAEHTFLEGVGWTSTVGKEEPPAVLFIQSPEGAVLCNECGVYIDDASDPEGHARDVHGGTVLQVVHPDDE